MGNRERNLDSELELFKTSISLAAYAESIGYQKDKNECTKNSWVMRRGDDKIVVATNALNGNGIYFSIRDDQDNGTIIDFVQRRQKLNLGQVRQELRKWTGEISFPYCPKKIDKPEPSAKDRQKVIVEYSRTRPDLTHHYLVVHRGLQPETLADWRFMNVVRIDSRNNAIFPHFDRLGLAGFEIKNKGFTGFAAGGLKALWYSANINQADEIVIVESAVDGLSHAQLTKSGSAYVSIAGSMSDHQRDLLRGLITKARSRGAKVIVGTDTDERGEDYAQEILEMGANDRVIPASGKDWNDYLRISYA